jgi:hypothetical protein
MSLPLLGVIQCGTRMTHDRRRRKSAGPAAPDIGSGDARRDRKQPDLTDGYASGPGSDAWRCRSTRRSATNLEFIQAADIPCRRHNLPRAPEPLASVADDPAGSSGPSRAAATPALVISDTHR